MIKDKGSDWKPLLDTKTRDTARQPSPTQKAPGNVHAGPLASPPGQPQLRRCLARFLLGRRGQEAKQTRDPPEEALHG